MIIKKQTQNGFTLLEILIAISIVAVFLGVVVYFGFDITGFNSFITENIISQNELQLTLNSLVTEIRSMGPSSIGGYPLETATSSSLIFYSDIDQDGLFERVRYFLTGATLMKGVIKPAGSPLAYNLTDEKTTEAVHYVISDPSSIFKYYGFESVVGDPPLSFPINPALVRSIRAELTTDRDIQSQPGAVTFSVFATIRNLRNTQ